jgi:hypothetical protein
MRMGKVIDGQSDHRPVQQRRRARKGPTTPSDLARRLRHVEPACDTPPQVTNRMAAAVLEGP